MGYVSTLEGTILVTTIYKDSEVSVNSLHLLKRSEAASFQQIVTWIDQRKSCFHPLEVFFCLKAVYSSAIFWFDHREFHVPKMEVLNLIRRFWRWVLRYISLTYSLYR